MRYLIYFLRTCVGLGVLLLASSFLGAFHPLGDSLAVFRNWIAIALSAVGFVTVLARALKTGLTALACAGAALLHIASFKDLVAAATQADPDLIVYAKNLGAGRTDWSRLASDIAETEADVVLLQEVTQSRMFELAELLPDLPYGHICNFSGWSAMAIVSRYPVSDTGCTDHRSLAYAVVGAPSGPVWVASIHQVWPFPYDQAALLPKILDAVADAPARQVIAGDFNMVPWGHSISAIMRAGGTQRISPVLPTIEVRGITLPIDHVLTNGSGTVSLRPRMGSDHRGLAARIQWAH